MQGCPCMRRLLPFSLRGRAYYHYTRGRSSPAASAGTQPVLSQMSGTPDADQSSWESYRRTCARVTCAFSCTYTVTAMCRLLSALPLRAFVRHAILLLMASVFLAVHPAGAQLRPSLTFGHETWPSVSVQVRRLARGHPGPYRCLHHRPHRPRPTPALDPMVVGGPGQSGA